MNWSELSAVFGGINFVTLLALAFQYGKLVQKVEDINEKGCARRNGCSK